MFWKRRNNINQIVLDRFIFHKCDNIYSHCNDFYYFASPKKKTYGINTVIRNVPLVVENGKLVAKIKYVTIPDAIIYFILHISNIKSEYISSSKTVDVIVTASIKNDECKKYKFKLLPIFERRALACI